jgi:predicted DNA-binding transcriptional regulator AlpA
MPNDKFLTLDDVMKCTNLKASTIYKLITTIEFPCPLYIAGSFLWSDNELSLWMIWSKRYQSIGMEHIQLKVRQSKLREDKRQCQMVTKAVRTVQRSLM